MSNYDGDIKLSMSLDPKDVKSASRELQNDIKEIFSSNAGKELDNNFKKLEVSMSKAASKAQVLQEKLSQLENQTIPTAEYTEIKTQIDKASDALVKLQERMDRFVETGGKTSSRTFKAMQYDAAQLENTIQYARGELQDLVDTGKAFTLGSDTAEYQNTINQLADVNNEMRLLTSRADEASGGVTNLGSTFTNVQKILSGFTTVCGKAGNALTNIAKKLWNIASSAVKSGIQGISNAIRGLGSSSSSADFSLKTMFWNMMKYGLGIRSLYVLFRRLRSAITEGLNNLAQFNGGANSTNAALSQLTSSLSYLQNAWAAAFAPILSFVAPVLSRLINMIAAVINTIGKLFAALSGRTSFTASKYSLNDYAAGLSSGGGGKKGKSAQEKYEEAQKKAQEKYEKQLAKTQEHNAKQVAKAEEKQAKAAKKLAEAQEEVNEELAHYDKLNVIAQEDLKDMDMEEYLPDLWEDPELEEVNWEDFLDASGAGDAFAEMFEEVPIDPWIQDLADKIKKMIDSLVEPIKKAWDRAKSYVISSAKNMWEKIKSLGKTIFDDFLEVWNQPETIAMLENIFRIFGDIFNIIGNIAEGLEEAWKKNDTGKHILENIRDIFAIIIQHVKNITEGLKDWSKELDFSPLMEAIERFTGKLKIVADFIGGVLEDIFDHLLKPYFKYVIEEAGPKFLQVFSDFIDKVDWNKLRENLDKIWKAVEHLAEAVTDGMIIALDNISSAVAGFLNSQEFDTFCTNLANFINSIDSETVANVLTAIGNGILKVVKDLVEFFNKLAASEAFQSFLNAILDWFKNASPDDIANALKLIAGAIIGFKFAGFVGKGVGACLDFLTTIATLTGSGGALTGAATVLGGIGEALGVILIALADIAAIAEANRLDNIVKAQKDLPKTASDLNGVNKEMNLFEKVAIRIRDIWEPGTIGDRMIAPSDYEKLENMTQRLNTMGQELGNNGQLSDEMAGKIDEAYSILGDNIDNVENLTDDQVQRFSALYREVENYYNKCQESDGAIQGIQAVGVEFEKIPEALPDEEAGEKGIVPFIEGVYKKVTTSFSDKSKFEPSGQNIVDGLASGIELGLSLLDPMTWWAAIKETWDTFWDSHSPSLVMEQEGIYLIEGLFNGVNLQFPVLVDMIVTYLNQLLDEFKTTWKNILDNCKTTWTTIKTDVTELFNHFKTTWADILRDATTSWTNIKTTITNKFTELRDRMKEIGDEWKRNLKELINAIKELFDGLATKITTVVNGIKQTIQNLVDTVLRAVETIKNALASISSMVSSGISSAASRVTSIRVPRLAQGAVIPPNREFMAVLGDQQSGTNIETPLSTMVEAFNKALDARGGTTNNEPIVLQLNSEVIAEAVWDEEEKRYKQRGDWEPLYT